MTTIVAALACAAGLAPALGAKAAKVIPQPVIESTQPVAAACISPADASQALLPTDGGGACRAAASKDASVLTGDRRPKLGYCQCGCGTRCATGADCGGSPCRAFITCS